MTKELGHRQGCHRTSVRLSLFNDQYYCEECNRYLTIVEDDTEEE